MKRLTGFAAVLELQTPNLNIPFSVLSAVQFFEESSTKFFDLFCIAGFACFSIWVLIHLIATPFKEQFLGFLLAGYGIMM